MLASDKVTYDHMALNLNHSHNLKLLLLLWTSGPVGPGPPHSIIRLGPQPQSGMHFATPDFSHTTYPQILPRHQSCILIPLLALFLWATYTTVDDIRIFGKLPASPSKNYHKVYTRLKNFVSNQIKNNELRNFLCFVNMDSFGI